MKTQTRSRQATQPKTQFIMVTTELQLNNQEVERAFNQIIGTAQELLRRFELQKYRTAVIVDHTRDPQNTSMVREFICHMWNITLSNNKDGRSFIFVDIDADSIAKLGNNLTNLLLRHAFHVTHSEEGTAGIEYALRVNYTPSNIQNFFYRRVVSGEDEYSSIITVDRLVTN